ncbi:MAG: response regulator [Phycisphaeraceae bacterium]
MDTTQHPGMATSAAKDPGSPLSGPVRPLACAASPSTPDAGTDGFGRDGAPSRPAPSARQQQRGKSGASEPSDRIRIMLADDHAIVREGLRSVLEHQSDFEIVGEAVDGEQTVEMALELEPDVILMDISMPQINGIEATRRLADRLPDTHIIGLSIHDDLSMANCMKEAGADDYLSKGGSAEELCRTIRSVSGQG